MPGKKWKFDFNQNSVVVRVYAQVTTQGILNLSSGSEIIESQPQESTHLCIFEGQCREFENEALHRCHTIDELLQFAVVDKWYLVDVDGTMKGNPLISDFENTILKTQIHNTVQSQEDIQESFSKSLSFNRNPVNCDSGADVTAFLAKDLGAKLQTSRDAWLSVQHPDYYEFLNPVVEKMVPISQIRAKLDDDLGEIDEILFKRSFPTQNAKFEVREEFANLGLDCYMSEVFR